MATEFRRLVLVCNLLISQDDSPIWKLPARDPFNAGTAASASLSLRRYPLAIALTTMVQKIILVGGLNPQLPLIPFLSTELTQWDRRRLRIEV